MGKDDISHAFSYIIIKVNIYMLYVYTHDVNNIFFAFVDINYYVVGKLRLSI